MIVATAGHVDHGKTTLVKALTGIDTDRLKEEKERGMSIDLGFAYAEFDDGQRLGFVDVPGHERFLRNMLAGVAAVDFALLTIAADDGPMPQTVEHLAILDLLGIRCGAVALTKIDRVPADRVEEVQAEIRTLLEGSCLADAPVFPLSAVSGEGIDALRAYLRNISASLALRPPCGNFRLVMDRSFVLPGAGLVAAGAVTAGTVQVGDHLIVSPQGIPVRVRAIHVHNRPVEKAYAGQRCALNIAGADLRKAEVGRGNWLLAPAAHAPSMRIDVRIKVLAGETRPLAHWSPVHLHIGAAVMNARAAILVDHAIAPGQQGLAQLVLDMPVAALYGERFVLRDQPAQRTIAGGTVIDPFGPDRGRAKPARLRQLAAMDQALPLHALTALVDTQPEGVDLDRFAQARNLTLEETDKLYTALPMHVVSQGSCRIGFSLSNWNAVRDGVLGVLQDWHRQQPESRGASISQLAAALQLPLQSALLNAVIQALMEQGRIRRAGFCLCLSEHVARLSEADAVLLDKVTGILHASGLRPPIVGELSRTLDMEQVELVEFLARVSALGHLVRVARNRFFLPGTVDELAQIARHLAAESPQGFFDAASYKNRSGIGRNLTIEVLEFLDRMHVTRFAGGRRRIV